MEKGAVIKNDIKKAANTGSWRNMRPKVDKSKCTGCSTCVKYCPEAAIELKPRSEKELQESEKKLSKNYIEIDYDFCKGCGVCSVECPFNSITMRKE